MIFNEKDKEKWEEDMWQSIGEHDVLMLRKKLRRNINLSNANPVILELNSKENRKF